MAEPTISESNLADVATKKRRIFDNIYITPATKAVTIRTIIQQLNAQDEVVSQEAAPDIVFKDAVATETEAEVTTFTDFMAELGLTKAKIVTAIKNQL